MDGVSSMPLMDMIGYVAGSGLVEPSEDLEPHIVLDRELKK